MSEMISELKELLKLKTAVDAAPITPHDSNDIPLCDALLIATGGTLKVITALGNTIIITVPAGLIPLQVTRVFNIGTSATGISALYN